MQNGEAVPKTEQATLHAGHETNRRIIADEQFRLSVCRSLQSADPIRRFLSLFPKSYSDSLTSHLVIMFYDLCSLSAIIDIAP